MIRLGLRPVVVYPEPPAVTVIDVMTVPVRVAVAMAPDPKPPRIATVGVEV